MIAQRRAIELIQYNICVGQKNQPPVLSVELVVAKLALLGTPPMKSLERSALLPVGRSSKVCGQATERGNERKKSRNALREL
jgi:hypothetical protein